MNIHGVDILEPSNSYDTSVRGMLRDLSFYLQGYVVGRMIQDYYFDIDDCPDLKDSLSLQNRWEQSDFADLVYSAVKRLDFQKVTEFVYSQNPILRNDLRFNTAFYSIKDDLEFLQFQDAVYLWENLSRISRKSNNHQ